MTLLRAVFWTSDSNILTLIIIGCPLFILCIWSVSFICYYFLSNVSWEFFFQQLLYIIIIIIIIRQILLHLSCLILPPCLWSYFVVFLFVFLMVWLELKIECFFSVMEFQTSFMVGSCVGFHCFIGFLRILAVMTLRSTVAASRLMRSRHACTLTVNFKNYLVSYCALRTVGLQCYCYTSAKLFFIYT